MTDDQRSGIIRKEVLTIFEDSATCPNLYVYDLNARGQAVGQGLRNGGGPCAFYWDGTQVDLGDFGAESGELIGINNSGLAVGYVSDSATAINSAVIYRDGDVAVLWRNGVAVDINDAEQVLGHVGNAPVVWETGDVTLLPTPAGVICSSERLNERGDAVGRCGQAPVVWRRLQ
jgi:hypothetical protein